MPIPYSGEELTFTNPDGEEIRVRGWGSQFAAVFETLDGYTVMKDPESGYLHYAVRSEDKASFKPSGTRVGQRDPQLLNFPQHIGISREAMKAKAVKAKEETKIRPRWEIRRQRRKSPPAQAMPTREAGEESSSPEDDEEPPTPAPIVGDYVGLCLLINFPDVQATIS